MVKSPEMHWQLSIVSAVTAIGLSATEPANVLRTTAGLRDATHADRLGTGFELQGKVGFCTQRSFTVEDRAGAIMLHRADAVTNACMNVGDTVRVTGVTYDDGWGNTCAQCQALRILSRGTPSAPRKADVTALIRGKCDYEAVRIGGIVRDAFRDEIDPLWYFLVLHCGDGTIYLSFSSPEERTVDVASLVGAEISAVGICTPSNPGYRRQLGRIFLVNGIDALRIIRASHDNPFDVPELGNLAHTPPSEISALGRHRVQGRVIAVWNGGNVLVKSRAGRIHRLELSCRELPRYGQQIEAAGLPETDLYCINLTRATWRRLPDAPAPPERISCLSAEELLSDRDGRRRIQTYFHGRAVRLIGTVRSLPASGNGDGLLYLESGSCLVAVSVSSVPEAVGGVSVGCMIESTGTYVVDTGNWRSNSAFPRTNGFLLVARSRDDIRILSTPSWWTPGRLLTLVGALLAAIGAILVWNLALRILVERRSRELLKEKIAHVGAELRIDERTRLAVELHDSIAQSLTGVSMQMDTAERLAAADPERMLRHLKLASASLQSCREELRSCLWDLRNQALNETDMNEAIRRTLKPHIGTAALSVRFNVPRSRISDNTAHALLRIIRELATNAVRHGHATGIRVAGGAEPGQLMFSVRDNGTGFAPQTAPGASEGHFGLQGIRERIRRLDGDMSIESEIGKGTKVVVTLHIPAPAAKGIGKCQRRSV